MADLLIERTTETNLQRQKQRCIRMNGDISDFLSEVRSCSVAAAAAAAASDATNWIKKSGFVLFSSSLQARRSFTSAFPAVAFHKKFYLDPRLSLSNFFEPGNTASAAAGPKLEIVYIPKRKEKQLRFNITCCCCFLPRPSFAFSANDN